MFRLTLEYACLLVGILHVTHGYLTTIDGQLVRIVDNCTPGDDSTCPSRQCCAKEGLAFIPEFEGPKPAYQIACRPYRQEGESCFLDTSVLERCPCELPLTCTSFSSSTFFGHCQ